MRHMLRIVALILVVSTILTVTSQGQSNFGNLSGGVIEAIQSKKSLNNLIRVNIILKDKVDIDSLSLALNGQNASLEVRAKTVMRTLMAKANSTQPALMDRIGKHASNEGRLLGMAMPLWITNLVVMEANSALLLDLAQDEAIEQIVLDLDPFIQPDLDRPNEPGTPAPEVANGTEPGLRLIKAPSLWSKGYTGRNRKVMSVDTGVNPHHPALRNQYMGRYVMPRQTWMQSTTMPYDCGGSSFHGTHTVGTMVGLDSLTRDTIGVAYQAKWMAANSLCSGGPGTLAAHQWAMNPDNDTSTIADMPDVINNSWGSTPNVSECTGSFRPVFTALEAAGVAVVFSAGNSGPGASTITSPKNINADPVNVFCVGNINGGSATLAINSSSSRGPSICGGNEGLLIKPEVSAPGTNIRSAGAGTSYVSLTGTSMAAPHAAGAVALLKEAFPYLTGTAIKMALYMTATDLGTLGEDNTFGRGMINLDSAFNYLSQTNIPEPPLSRRAYDLVLDQVISPGSFVCSGPVTPTIIVRNIGDSTIYGYNASCRTTTGQIVTSASGATLLPGQTDTLNFPTVLINTFTGTQFFHFSVSNAGISERDSFNNMRAWPVRMRNTGTLPYLNGFSGGTITSNGVQVGNSDSLTTWTAINANTPSGFGPAATLQSRNYTFRGEMDRLFLPVFNLNNNTNWILKFKVAYRPHTNGRKDSLFIRYSDDCHGVTNTLAILADSSLNTGTAISNTFNPFAVTEWKEVTFNLSSLLNPSGQLNLFFEWKNDNGNNVYLDDINILSSNATPIASFNGTQSPTCLPITLTLNNNSSLADSVRFVLSNGQVISGNSASITYTTGGSYTNTLIAFNSNGNDTLNQTVNIPFDPAPDFSVSDTLYIIGVSQPITFTNLSQHATNFNWVFGDGTTSNQQNPGPKTYNNPGVYTVLLQAANPNCMNTITKTNLIRVDIAANNSALTRQGWHLYPNPARNLVNLKLPEGVQLTSVQLLNTLGQRLGALKFEGESQNITLSLPAVRPGYYRIEAIGRGGEQVNLPLVIE